MPILKIKMALIILSGFAFLGSMKGKGYWLKHPEGKDVQGGTGNSSTG